MSVVAPGVTRWICAVTLAAFAVQALGGPGRANAAEQVAPSFEGLQPGTNPEELIAAAHASCFTMALSFALAKVGITDGTLETEARVKLDKDGDGFKVSRSDLTLSANVALDEARLRELAEDAKKNCPISKLLNAEMSLEVRAQPA